MIKYVWRTNDKMTKIRYLFKNITLLNALLMGAIFIMANYTVLPLMNINIKYALPSQKKTFVEKEPAPSEHDVPSPSDYVIISEENLFHPERRIPPEKKADEAALPKPEFVLYGTLVSDTTSLAYLEDLKAPRNSPGRGKRQTTLKKGDTMSGFTLKEIDVDKVVMARGEEKMVVPVNDPQRPKTREAAATVAHTAPGKPAPLPQRSPAARQQRGGSPSADSLIKREPPPRTRAPMTPADERIRKFLQSKP
jgi:hypothetical protein